MRRLLNPGEKSYENKKKSNITVVIPSLGGRTLSKTIMFLNKGSVKPDQILICVPKSVYPKSIQLKKYSNVKIIQCPNKGQVDQKIYGFSKIQTKYTLQLDEDILVDKNCLKTFLYGAITKSNKSAFGGVLRSKNSNIKKYLFPNLFQQLLNLIINGKKILKMRTVLNTGVPTSIFDQKYLFLSKSEWLNGVLFTKTRNLINFVYYNFDGKAYNEDVIHSGILRSNKIDLYVNNKAICFEQTASSFNRNEVFDYRFWIKIYKTRKIIISYYKGSFRRMILKSDPSLYINKL